MADLGIAGGVSSLPPGSSPSHPSSLSLILFPPASPFSSVQLLPWGPTRTPKMQLGDMVSADSSPTYGSG